MCSAFIPITFGGSGGDNYTEIQYPINDSDNEKQVSEEDISYIVSNYEECDNIFQPNVYEITSSTSATVLNCLIVSIGNGTTIPPINAVVRPRLITIWLASDGYTAINISLQNKIIFANGSQFAIALGFTGYCTIIDFFPLQYLVLGHALFLHIRAETIEYEQLI